MTSKGASKGVQERAYTVGVLLQKLDQGQYPKSIAKDLNKSKQLINYYLRQLESKGYIKRKVRSTIAIYELLPKGKAFLERHDSLFRRGVLPRFHHYAHRLRVLGGFEGLDVFLPLVGGIQMRGGVVQVDGSFEWNDEKFSVRRWHSSSGDQLFIYAPAVYGKNVGDVLVSAGIKLDRVAHAIQEKFGIQLSEYERLQKPEFAFERDPYARYWMEISAGAIVKTETGTIDASEGEPEAEFFTAEDAAAYLKMPQEVKKQGAEIQQIRDTFKEIAHDYRKTTDQFGKEMESHLTLIGVLTKTTEALGNTTEKLSEIIAEMRKEHQSSVLGRLASWFREEKRE